MMLEAMKEAIWTGPGRSKRSGQFAITEQQHRPNNIKLLLYTQRPKMQ
jgi:hypothetical protein